MLINRDEMKRPREDGFLDKKRGKRLLPDIRTAILARMRGYVGGFYPSPLKGAASELGYFPLSEATPQELMDIEEEANRLLGGN